MPVTSPSPAAGIPQLSWWSFGSALTVTLVIFFALHPFWRPMDMDAMDRNIAWSYLPIPLLVAALLALEHKLRWSSWALETIRLTFVKFVITFLFANILWAFIAPPSETSAPPVAPPSGGQVGRYEPRAPPPATPIDPARTGRIAGVVVDAAGAPQAGALVGVTDGLERLVFAPPPEGVLLNHDGNSFQPPAVIVQVYEKVVVRGASDSLHTARALDADGRLLFNVPLLPGAERTLMFDRPLGFVTLTCTVHGQADHAAQLAVVSNPFAAWTDSEGRFAFDGVPSGNLQLTAWGSAHVAVSLPVSLAPGGAAEGLRLKLP